MVEARYPSKMTPTSMFNIYEVFQNIHVLWMCIWMNPYRVTASLTKKAFRSCPEFWVLPLEGIPTV
jgi:hypothetical protein